MGNTKRVRKDESEWVIKQNENWRIIEDDVWHTAQKNRLDNTRPDFGHGPKRAAYVLTGLFRCGVCNRAVAGHWQQNRDGSNRYHYYRCRHSMSGDQSCSNRSRIRGLDIERVLIAEIESSLFSKISLDEVAREIAVLLERRATDSSTLEELIQRQRNLKAESKKLIDLAFKVTDMSEIEDELKRRKIELQAIERLIVQSTPKSMPDPMSLLPQVQERAGKTIELLKTTQDVAELRTELSHWIDNLRLEANGQVSVKWKGDEICRLFNFDPTLEMGEEGSHFAYFPSHIKSFSDWHSLSLQSNEAASATIPMSGFSGFSEFRKAEPQTFGFSGFSGFPAQASA